MFLLLAALATSPRPIWWTDFQNAYKRCGLVFNVDGPGPAGDGVIFQEDFNGVVLSSNRRRPQKPIRCIGRWARSTRIKVRYRNF
jgi:hypothetical protein